MERKGQSRLCHERPALDVRDAEGLAVLPHRDGAEARRAGRVIQRSDDALLRHEIGDDLLLPPHVVARGDRIRARL